MRACCHPGRFTLILLALTILSPHRASGQKNAIWLGGGIQASRMDDMKYLQGLVLETYPTEGKIISSFPPYTMGSFGWANRLYPTVRVGLGYGFSSTGAKSNYTDYSGYITSQINAVSHGAGAFASYSVMGGDWFEVSVIGRLNMKYTRVDVSTTIYALGASGYNDNSYSSWSPGGAGGLEFLIHLKKYSFGLEGGYEIDAPGKLSSRENKNELKDPNDPDRVLATDWSGWYAQARFMLWLDFQ